MGVLYSKCILCNTRCSEDNHLVQVISLGKRHGQIFCIDCFVNQRLEYINEINLQKYYQYVHSKYNGN